MASTRPSAALRGVVASVLALLAMASPSGADPVAESGDTVATATAMQPRSSYSGTISATTDADWFTIDPTDDAWIDGWAGGGPEVTAHVTSACSGEPLRIRRVVTIAGRRPMLRDTDPFSASAVGIVGLPDHPTARPRYDVVVELADGNCPLPIDYVVETEPSPITRASYDEPVESATHKLLCDTKSAAINRTRIKVRKATGKRRTALLATLTKLRRDADRSGCDHA